MADNYIQVNSVSKHFGVGEARKMILNKISFPIEKGSFVSIIGPSGCGKSTMLQIIAGLQEAAEGEVILGNKKVDAPPFDMVYLFQQYNKSIFPWKTVKENVKFGMESRKKWSKSEIEQRSNEMIELVGLYDCRDYYTHQLSGGMQQRVAIARALACEPDVLLMDEPFSAVDAMTRGSLQDLVLDLWTKLGLTILFVTHDIDEAVYLSSRVIVLNRAPRNLAADVSIDLPYPRERLTTPEMPNFLKYRHQLYEEIFDAEKRGNSEEIMA
ncbi:ABC transporter [Domibacillus antri]|uniref:ABC transporter n=1 Tax=Domibacillus antri TaxID=1714264 RepID=A0A1Q8Q6N6_9BACI|nr:ABC transporter ATP-binding protein [Domibacillus antri]OLN23008.1 ABC transporter [Domibacillus antri]